MPTIRRSLRRAPRPAALALAAAALAFAAPAPPAAAQTVNGIVRDAETGARLAGVLVSLVDRNGVTRAETLANDSGAFHLDAPGPGSYALHGSLLGYAEIASEAFEVAAGEEIAVEVRLAVEAVPLEPIVVMSRQRRMDSQLEGFYDRMTRGRRSGLGYFVSREDIDRYSPSEATDLLRMAPGVRVVRGVRGGGAGLRMTTGCIPAVYVDGIQVNRHPMTSTSLDDIVSALSVEGIEVYRGASASMGSYYDPTGCGLVLVWTRRGEHSDEPWSWKKFLAGVGLLGALLLLMR